MRGIAETAIMTAALLAATFSSTGPAAAAMVDGMVDGLTGKVRSMNSRQVNQSSKDE